MANTLRAYFEGCKESFEGLKIYNYEKDWTKYPVAYFDFVDSEYSDPVSLIVKIRMSLWEFERYNVIDFDEKFIKEAVEKDDDKSEGRKLSYRFRFDMQTIYEKTGLKTVIIVDEYDNPLITSENLPESKKIYRGFFSVLKSSDQYIRFAFITGVTKFAKTSIFSGQNQPNDITEGEKYSAICGITHEELIANFTPVQLKISWRESGIRI